MARSEAYLAEAMEKWSFTAPFLASIPEGVPCFNIRCAKFPTRWSMIFVSPFARLKAEMGNAASCSLTGVRFYRVASVRPRAKYHGHKRSNDSKVLRGVDTCGTHVSHACHNRQ